MCAFLNLILCISFLLNRWLIILFLWISSVREKRPRDEEEFETMAFEGFEAIGFEDFQSLSTSTAATDDRQLVITPSARPQPLPEVKSKTKKKKVDIPPRVTRSKAVKPSSNTRSKRKM